MVPEPCPHPGGVSQGGTPYPQPHLTLLAVLAPHPHQDGQALRWGTKGLSRTGFTLASCSTQGESCTAAPSSSPGDCLSSPC